MPDAAADDLPLDSVVVLGLGVTGRAVVEALRAHGVAVSVVDDHPSDAVRAAATSLGVELLEAPSEQDLVTALTGADALLPSPGVPDRHPVFVAAARAGVPVLSEFDLAARWDSRPIVAITGTDGKTTVTTMVTEMLTASGRRADRLRQHRHPVGRGHRRRPARRSSWSRRRRSVSVTPVASAPTWPCG